MRSLYSVSLVQILIFLPFIISNTRDQMEQLNTNFVEGIVGVVEKQCTAFIVVVLPCNFLYSRISFDLAYLYVFTLVVYAIIRFQLLIKLLIREMSDVFQKDYEQDANNTLKITQMFFNGWDWRVSDKIDS